jgi:hypothetical protein
MISIYLQIYIYTYIYIEGEERGRRHNNKQALMNADVVLVVGWWVVTAVDASLHALKEQKLVPLTASIDTLSELYGKDVHVFLHILRFALCMLFTHSFIRSFTAFGFHTTPFFWLLIYAVLCF